jgi:hypothetical protein
MQPARPCIELCGGNPYATGLCAKRASLQDRFANRLDASLRTAIDADLSKSSVPQRCHATPLRKKKARGYGLEMVAGPGFESENGDTGE